MLLARWRARCAHLLVDEVQDVDRSQLELALCLAAPANRVFLVGDDDQSIYGWRLADVRRVLALDAALPGLRRVDLEVNHRCPAPVVERAVRLIEHNAERFAKTIRARAAAPGRVILAPDAADEPARTLRLIAVAGRMTSGSQAILARTNRELRPAVVAALALASRSARPAWPCWSTTRGWTACWPRSPATTPDAWPLLVRVGARPSRGGPGRARAGRRPLLAWAAGVADLAALVAAVADTRARLAELRRDDARLTLATAHSTKGAEFDHVVGRRDGRGPASRAVGRSAMPTTRSGRWRRSVDSATSRGPAPAAA